MSDDSFGDRMKGYEAHETSRRFLPGLPVYARIDGRSFSKFTKGMRRPFDERMTHAMVKATRHLVDARNRRSSSTARSRK
jgi:tRNA(His) 5'-end guanylyltransferase